MEGAFTGELACQVRTAGAKGGTHKRWAQPHPDTGRRGTSALCEGAHSLGWQSPKHRTRVTCGQGQSPPNASGALVSPTWSWLPASWSQQGGTGEHYWGVCEGPSSSLSPGTWEKPTRHTLVRQPTSQSPPGALEQAGMQRGSKSQTPPSHGASLASVSSPWDGTPTPPVGAAGWHVGQITHRLCPVYGPHTQSRWLTELGSLEQLW